MITVLVSGKYDFFEERLKIVLSGILEHRIIDIKYSTTTMIIDCEMIVVHSALIIHK
jgi:hypothetical protein